MWSNRARTPFVFPSWKVIQINLAEAEVAAKKSLLITVKCLFRAQERDPFYEPPTSEVLIGSVTVFLQSLAYMIEYEEELTIFDFGGQDMGRLSLALTPCSSSGKEIIGEYLENPDDLVTFSNCLESGGRRKDLKQLIWYNSFYTCGILSLIKFTAFFNTSPFRFNLLKLPNIFAIIPQSVKHKTKLFCSIHTQLFLVRTLLYCPKKNFSLKLEKRKRLNCTTQLQKFINFVETPVYCRYRLARTWTSKSKLKSALVCRKGSKRFVFEISRP